MNTKRTNEEFNVEEIQQVEEFVVFRAEEYRGKEILENKEEEYKVEEIHEDTPSEDKKEYNSQSNDNSDFVRKHISSSISSTISSIGSAGVFVAAVAVGGGVILNEPIDYGQINTLNYRVDYYMENNELVSDVIVHIENELLDKKYF